MSYYIADLVSNELFELGKEEAWSHVFCDFKPRNAPKYVNRIMGAFTRIYSDHISINQAECYSDRIVSWLGLRSVLLLITEESHKEIFHNMWVAVNNPTKIDNNIPTYQITGSVNGL
jgi:hypothetical protein